MSLAAVALSHSFLRRHPRAEVMERLGAADCGTPLGGVWVLEEWEMSSGGRTHIFRWKERQKEREREEEREEEGKKKTLCSLLGKASNKCLAAQQRTSQN